MAVKKTEVKEATKKATTQIKKTVQETAAAVAENAPVVAEAAKESVIETAEKAKTVAKKATDKTKTVAKKAAESAKAETKKISNAKIEKKVVLQYQFREMSEETMTDLAIEAYKAVSKKAVKSLELYLKPEENAVYYVVNGEFNGKIDF
jgi:23S rRNA G2069 N7-methylase RlmK/C1962 C5-methylase RlmI